MGELNVGNRTLAIMDNLPFLRSLNNECIDLIAIDPPFAANETFTGNPRPPSATPNTPRKLPGPGSWRSTQRRAGRNPRP